MKKSCKSNLYWFVCLSVILFQFCGTMLFAKDPVDYVDPFIGTSSSRWMLYPGPCLPFGMVKLSPDNTDGIGFDAGYEYKINSISGFGHVHSWMMGSFLTMPTTGELQVVSGSIEDPDAGYRSRFYHEQETASPGYYAVTLEDYQIRAELTTTTRAGFQRYTFPKSETAHILFDLNIPEEGRSTTTVAQIRKVSQTEIEGYLSRDAGWNVYTLYFVAELSRPFESFGGWIGEKIYQNVDKVECSEDLDIGAFLKYKTDDNEIILLKSAISYVSIEQARLNLENEMSDFGWDFDAARVNARSVWNNILGKIEVEGANETLKTKFYTNMYRAYSSRTIFSDVNGKYVDMCENVQQLKDPDSPVYGCDAFWNTFWNLNQLWALVSPDIMSKWVGSLLEIYDRGGWLPKGPGGIEYSGIMVASHAIPMIVSAWQKGIRDFDIKKAYEAIKHNQMEPGQSHECGGHVGNLQLTPYLENGYVPEESGPVSNTLEYAYDDWCVAQLAKSLGEKADYDYFMQRSMYYKNVFDPSSGYMRPKQAGGPWKQNFTPLVKAVGKEDAFGGKDYVEGNAWQYTWFAPHDVKGLIGLLGVEEFNQRLDEGFEKSRPNFVSHFVNHSNQPNMQAAYLFNYSQKPWLTQKWVREMMEHYYGLGPVDGYPGDEDQGQMGAWYVMSAIGLFEMDGGARCLPIYEIGSPVFEKITIHLDKDYYPGETFVIEAKNCSQKNRYIQSASLNGTTLNKFWFNHSQLVSGGKLVLNMGSEPNKKWATGENVLPDFDVVQEQVRPPYVESDNKYFLNSTTVSLGCDTRGAEIYYTLDGSQPTLSSRLYITPFTLNQSGSVKMRAFKKGQKPSLVATARFEKAILQNAAKIVKVEPGLIYSYYQGDFNSNFLSVSDLNELTPTNSGIVTHFNTELAQQDSYFGFTFKGIIQVPKDGIYTLYLTSNDGSKLYLDDKELINSDGLHPIVEESVRIALKAGNHPVRVKYFQAGGGQLLKLSWEGPGIKKQEIPAGVLFHEVN